MATKKISQLPLDTAVTGPDLMPIVSDGATKRVTLTTLSGFFSAAGPTGATGPSGAGEAYQGATAPASASAGAEATPCASKRRPARSPRLTHFGSGAPASRCATGASPSQPKTSKRC